MPQRPRVTVLGSLNTDISVTVRQLPGPGETVLGSAAVISAGGKGANQAVAAARLGAAVRMTGCVGDDDFGGRLAGNLAAEGVDTSGVRPVAGVVSGLALISVDPTGENTITVAPGANGLAAGREVAAAFAAACDVVVLSAEVPLSTLAAALARARAGGVISVVNLAPVPEGAGELIAAGVDWLVVNVPEAAAVLGRPVRVPAPDVPVPDVPGPDVPGGGVPAPDVPGGGGSVPEAGVPGAGAPDGGGRNDAWQAAADLVAAGARHAVITLGAAGAVVAAGPQALAGRGEKAGHGALAGPGEKAGHGAMAGPGGMARPEAVAGPGAMAGTEGIAGAGAVAGPGAPPGAGTRAGGQAAGTARPGPGSASAGASGRTAWDGRPVLVPGFAVAAVDSVGAGDAFVGALAVALAGGAGPVSAVRAACAAGAAAVTRHGAQAALPGVADIRAVTGQEEWPQFGTGGAARAGGGQP